MRFAVLYVILPAACLISACGSNDQPDAPPTMPGSAPARALPVKDDAEPASADEVVMRTGLKVVFQPLLRGLTSSDRYSLTLTSWQLGPASADFTAPERMRGSVTVSEAARQTGRAFVGPFFWGTGANKAASGPLVWLSQKAFEELRDAGSTVIAPGSLAGGMHGGRTASSAESILRKTGSDTHTLTMIDRRVRVPVIVAEDDTGTRYEILDTSANPLVVAVRYGAQSKVGGQSLSDPLSAGSGYDVIAVEPAAEAKPARTPEQFGAPERITSPHGHN
jgi:hypothetical protein